jgi:hypothetical protein
MYGNPGNNNPGNNPGPNYPGGNYPGNYGDQRPTLYGGYQAPKKQRHPGRRLLTWLVVIVVILVGLDFGAKAFAENEAAIQIQKHGFPKKPTVSIAGFPFLTQVASRHFDAVTISSGNIPEGPITISSLNVTASNVHLASNFQSGTAGPLNGTVVISLGALGNALSDAGPLASFLGGGKQALKITSVGSNLVKGSLNLAGGLVSESATWRVEMAGPNKINLHLISSSGLAGSLAGAASNISIPISQLPAGLQLTGGLNSSSSGITAHVFASSFSFGG